MKSVIALEDDRQLRSGLLVKNHEEETERQIGKAFEVAGTMLCCVALCPGLLCCWVVLHCIALFFEYHS